MKIFRTLLFASLCALVLVSCKKESPDSVLPPDNTPVNQLAGLGTTTGYPSGKKFDLPKGVSLVGYIRGGLSGKAPYDKTYKGPFDLSSKSTYADLGTGTYVNLYMTLYNANTNMVNFSMPGGLIFVDSNDVYHHDPVYQKGYILQEVHLSIDPQDTAYIHLRAYCLNHTLAPSSYSAVYFFGPVTSNPNLNQITGIMATKQYPFGEEYNIQTIVWNVTDYGQNLTAADISYLNGLP